VKALQHNELRLAQPDAGGSEHPNSAWYLHYLGFSSKQVLFEVFGGESNSSVPRCGMIAEFVTLGTYSVYQSGKRFGPFADHEESCLRVPSPQLV
jgi:hypothetical protein